MSQPAIVLPSISGQVRISHATGLHARPSVMFTRLAKTFIAIIDVSDNARGPWIDAKSIVKVMRLKAPFGSMLFIRAAGLDAESAVKQLSRLVEDDFLDIQTFNGSENAEA